MTPPSLSGDYAFQADFVARSAWRLLALQDSNPLSATHGCFHLAYWRDKTSEFADARFQEASATLGLLSLPCFDALRQAAGAPPADMLRAAFLAGLGQWSRMQYPDGAFDEWYKGERGYASVAFTTIAFGFAHRYMAELIPETERAVLRATMTRAAQWLLGRWDRVKANHEAAGAAALALAWQATGDERFRQGARDKLADTLARQQPEGWFPEVGGMDLGYCSVLLDYAMLAMDALGEDVALPAMQRLFTFMAPHIQPDGTILAESGLCLNPYVSRLGTGLLSAKADDAAALCALFAQSSAGTAGLAPTMADDLRLCRWSHLPLVTALEAGKFRTGGASLAQHYPAGWTIRAGSAIAAFHRHDLHVFFAAAGGGQITIFDGAGKIVAEDRGLSVTGPDGVRTSQGYGPDRVITTRDGGVETTLSLCRPSFFFPSFLERLVLRAACTTALGAKWIRAAIDFYRVRNRTAINQSAAPLDKGTGDWILTRRVDIAHDAVTVEDRVTAPVSIAANCLNPHLRLYMPAGCVPRITAEGPAALRIVKRIPLGSDDREEP